jgi:hypothetical protein
MELIATNRYLSNGFELDSTTAPPVVGPVSVDGLEVIDEQVVMLAPLTRSYPRLHPKPAKRTSHVLG